jgi:hypothetical protein
VQPNQAHIWIPKKKLSESSAPTLVNDEQIIGDLETGENNGHREKETQPQWSNRWRVTRKSSPDLSFIPSQHPASLLPQETCNASQRGAGHSLFPVLQSHVGSLISIAHLLSIK